MPKDNKQKANMTITLDPNDKFSRLPSDIILLILNWLENPRDLVRSSGVAKIFYKLASDNRLWNKFLEINLVPKREELATDPNLSKKIFLSKADSIKPQYTIFAPLPFRAQKAQQTLEALRKSESLCGVGESSLSATFKFEEMLKEAKKKNTVKKTIRQFLGKPSATPTQPKTSDVINCINSLPLKLLNEVIDKINETNRQNNFYPFIAGNLNKLLIEMVNEYGEKAAILQPGCLEKMLAFLDTGCTQYEMFVLSNVLGHKKMQNHPNLASLMDDIFKYIKNPKLLGQTLNPVNIHSKIVEAVLKPADLLEEKAQPGSLVKKL